MRPYHLFLAVPALAMVLMPFLPFVNTAGLWIGLPRMMVWAGGWCILLCPAFLLTEHFMAREQGRAGDDES